MFSLRKDKKYPEKDNTLRADRFLEEILGSYI